MVKLDFQAMNETWKEALWGQLGAAIAMVENALRACPEELLVDRSRRPELSYMAYHTLFYVDYFCDPAPAEFRPAAFDSFGLAELLDEKDAPPFERAYTKAELLGYLEGGREKCRSRIAALTDEEAARRADIDWLPLPVAEVLLYNLRHVQHHAAQLNLLLRQAIDEAPRWVARTRQPLRDSGA
jgi:hypothetical protein